MKLMLMSRLLMVICFSCSALVLLKKHKNQIEKTSYGHHQQVHQIQMKMEIMSWKVQTNDLKEAVNKVIPDSTEKDMEKANLLNPHPRPHDVVISKVKMLKKLNLNWENSWSFTVKVVVLEKLLGMR